MDKFFKWVRVKWHFYVWLIFVALAVISSKADLTFSGFLGSIFGGYLIVLSAYGIFWSIKVRNKTEATT